jgi:hypothetical protein
MARYVVTAPSRVLGHPPGGTFHADLDPVQERRLLTSGALELTGSLDDLTRHELDAVAVEHGIPNPQHLHTKAAVIAAINQEKEASDGQDDRP